MATCNNDFFRVWDVEYLDEPQYSGEMEIRRIGSGISVSGTILENGALNGSYTGFNISCPDDEHDMTLRFRLASGHAGSMTLNLSEVDFGNPFIDGRYDDDGRGGDWGRIRLRPSSSQRISLLKVMNLLSSS